MAYKELGHLQRMKAAARNTIQRRVLRRKGIERHTLKTWSKQAGSRVWETLRYYSVGLWNYIDEDHCFLLASGIAFNVLYSFIPLSLLLFYFFSTALSGTDAQQAILDYLLKSIPVPSYRTTITEWFTSQLEVVQRTGAIAGIIGAVTLIWISSALFSTLRTSVNAVFALRPRSNQFVLKLLDIAVMLVVMVLLLAATFATPILNLIQQVNERILPESLEGYASGALSVAISAGLAIVIYVILFSFLPHRRLPKRVALVSAMTTVILTEAMRYAFAYYIGQISSIGAIYGTYAFIIGVSLWVYYISLAFMIGAEVGWLYWERHDLGKANRDFGIATPDAAIDQSVLDHLHSDKVNPAQPTSAAKPPADVEGRPIELKPKTRL